MNNYRMFLLVILVFAVSCKKVTTPPEEDRNVTLHGSESFKRFDVELNVEDFIEGSGKDLLVVGNGKDPGGFMRQGFVMSLDQLSDISWLHFWDIDQRNIYRRMSIIPTFLGGYYVLSGAFSYTSTDLGFLISKLDSEGEIIWEKRLIKEGQNLRSTAVVQLPTEDIIVLSWIQDPDSFTSSQFQLNKYSSTGEIIWEKIYNDVNITAARQLIVIPSDNSLMTLSEYSISGTGEQLIIHKLDFEGNLLWQKSISAPGKIWPTSSDISLINEDHVMVTYTSTNTPLGSNNDAYVVKLDMDGKIEWEKSYTGAKTELTTSIIQAQDGQYVLLSATSSFGNGNLDLMLSKLDQTGEILWEKVYGGESSELGTKVVERDNGELVILGNTNEGNNSDLQYDLFVLETDKDGTPQ